MFKVREQYVFYKSKCREDIAILARSGKDRNIFVNLLGIQQGNAERPIGLTSTISSTSTLPLTLPTNHFCLHLLMEVGKVKGKRIVY